MASEMTNVFDPQNAESSEIVEWLRHALTEYQKTQSRWSFSPISLLIGNRDDLAHDLHAYIESLSSASKRRWNKAILRLISDQSIQDEHTLITLVDLAVLSRSSDLLKLLPDLARKKYVKGRLLDRIINAVLELPTSDEASRECLEAVVSNVAFPVRSANKGFLTLCRIAPDDWIDHARLVSEKIPKPSNPEDKGWSYLNECAESVLLSIGLERLGAHWYEFVNDGDLNWLRDSLLTGDAPLVSAEENKLTSSLFPSREIEIQSESADRWSELMQSLQKLRITFDKNKNLDDPESIDLSIDNGVVALPLEFKHVQDEVSATEFVSSIPLVFSHAVTKPIDEKQMIEVAAKRAVGFLFLVAAEDKESETGSTDLEAPPSLNPFYRAIDQLIGMEVKQDRRRRSTGEDFNIGFSENGLRMPPEAWDVLHEPRNAALLVRNLSFAQTEDSQAEVVDWESARVRKARELALGEIITRPFMSV